MKLEWDTRKEAANLKKHGFDFETAALVFDDPHHLSVQDRDVDGEERWQTIGFAGPVPLLLIAHTVFEEGETTIRIISARRTMALERLYEEDL